MSPRALARAAAGGLLVAVALIAWPLLRDAVRAHAYFAVREVAVRGQVRLAPDEIRRLAGVEPGMSIWDVDRDAAERRLRAEPWIRTATVRRQVPHCVTIQVREERPVAILATDAAGGRAPALYYVAAHGYIFAPLGTADARDFPYLTGLTAADLDGSAALGPRAMRRALALLRLVARSGVPVSEVHVDRVRGLTVLPVRPTVPIEVGWGGFEAKLARLPTVLALWSGREAEIAVVSLLFDDEVIVRTRTPPSPPGRRPAAGA